MKPQTKVPERQSDRSPSRMAVQGSRPTLPQKPAGQPRPARPRGRQCGGRSRRNLPRQLRAQRPMRSAQSAPQPDLTLVRMHGMRPPRVRNSGRCFVWLLSGFVLLAWACFPVVAQADSAGTQYENGVPTPTGTHTVPGPSAQTSTVGGGAPGRAHKSSGSGGGSSTGGSSSGKGNGGSVQGSPQSGSSKNAANNLTPTAQPSGSTPSSSGSSPVVPILVAVAVLAAITVGVVTMRQRRQRQASSSPVSPKAS